MIYHGARPHDTLNVDLGGNDPGTEIDMLSISGLASLGGILNVMALDGFVPSAADVFQVLAFGSVIADFDSVNSLGFGNVNLTPVVRPMEYVLEAI